MAENSLKNLKKGNLADKNPSERKEIARKGALKANEIKAQKVERENALAWLWDNYGIDLAADIIQNGSIKENKEIM